MSMLVITVRNTSNGILIGLSDGEISLDYRKAGWLDIVRTRKFKSFCKDGGYQTQRVLWGKERIIRAKIGTESSQAADAIDACFASVFGETGSFSLELRGFGWRPSNNSFESDSAKPHTSS
ncbi:MAG: hypothetical protein HWE27_16095 [Gammaproteobacteria bacterium]|nr:hypothetical protein [Gammaproteobacteria bacterium]